MIIREVPPGIVYKLHEGNDPNGMMGAMLREASPHINRGRMSAKVTISRQTPDRSRDTVVSKGGRFQNHRKIPIACVAHNRNYVAGMAENRLGEYTVKLKGIDAIEAETFFDQGSELGVQSFRLVEDKVLRGASIGFIPIGVVTKSHAGGNHYEEWELIEYSHLPIPDHPDCIVEAVYKNYSGKALCDPLMNLLKPMVPERPPVVTSGFAGDSIEINGKRYVAADSIPPVVLGNPNGQLIADLKDVPSTTGGEPTSTPMPTADARRVFDADVHREVNGWQIVKDEHAGVCHYVVRDPANRTEAYRHGKWEAVKQWAELNSVPFDSATVKSWDESKHNRDHGKFTSGGGSGDTTAGTHKPRSDAERHADAHEAGIKPYIDEANSLMPTAGSGTSEQMDAAMKFVTKLATRNRFVIFEVAKRIGIKKIKPSDPERDVLKKIRERLFVIKPIESKSFPAPLVHKTYLQRMRVKAMTNPEDDTLPGAAAPVPVDDTLPPDPNAAPVDPNADPAADADMDGMTDQMKPFAQMCHTAHEQLLQITQGLEAALADTEHPGAAKMAEKVKAAVGKAMASVTAAFADYKEAHPDQPDIPGAEAAPEGMDADEGEEDETPDGDEDTEDESADMEYDDADESEDDDDPKPKEKAWAQYSVKCLQNYWDYINAKAFQGDKPAMEAAEKLLAKIAADKKHPFRNEARVVIKQLQANGIVEKAVETDDGWAGFKPEDFALLQKQVGTLTTAYGSLTS